MNATSFDIIQTRVESRTLFLLTLFFFFGRGVILTFYQEKRLIPVLTLTKPIYFKLKRLYVLMLFIN